VEKRMPVINGSFGSRLVFADNNPPSLTTDLKDLTRVREPISRSCSGVRGKVADVLNEWSRHAESQNEVKAFRVLVATGRADAWQEQPFFLEYHCNRRKHRYTPDVLIAWGSHREVVEIKEDGEADLPENQERFALISQLLGEHGYQFRLWKATEICSEPRLTNAGLVLRYRRVRVDPVERERIRLAFSASPEIRLGTFCDAVGIATVPSVLRLVLDGTLYIDWWRRLSSDSWVSVRPLGPRVWPSPPFA
jgi:hypothetical protein